MDDELPVLDWLNLPKDAKTTSLWGCLHDSDLKTIASNLYERSMTLEFDVPYLRNFHKLPESLRFLLVFNGVQSVRIDKYVVWPGEFSEPPDASYEEQIRAVEIYQSKWREESDSWSDFEARLSAGKIEVEISNAILARRGKDQLALKIELHINDESFHQVFIRSERLGVSRSDGLPFGLEQFLELGENYWDAFAARKPQ